MHYYEAAAEQVDLFQREVVIVPADNVGSEASFQFVVVVVVAAAYVA